MADFTRSKQLEDAKHLVLSAEAVYTSAVARRAAITTELTDLQTAQTDWETEILLRVQPVGPVT
jgi:hypothetical protein